MITSTVPERFATAHRAAAAEPSLSPLPDGPPARGGAVVIEDLTRRYGSFPALTSVSLRVEPREIVCLLGPSGSGKSTLLRLVAGIERPTTGRISLGSLEVAGPARFVDPERRRVGMVFQDYALFPHLTVAENIVFGLSDRPRAEARAVTEALLERVGLRRLAGRYPHMLSGGERQRVAVARALAPQPRVLLMDEPFSSLDGSLRDHVRQHTLDLLRETGTTAIIVTHEPGEAVRIADRIALLQEGRLVQYGSAEEIYARPASIAAARMFGEVNEVRGTCRSGRIATPLGSFAAPQLVDRAAASVCIRPQHLRLAAQPTDIFARVLETSFLGDGEQVALTVPGIEAPLKLRTSGQTRLEPGDGVYLSVEADGVVVIANDRI